MGLRDIGLQVRTIFVGFHHAVKGSVEISAMESCKGVRLPRNHDLEDRVCGGADCFVDHHMVLWDVEIFVNQMDREDVT